MVYADEYGNMDKFDKTLTRRDFLLATGLLLLSGKTVYDEIVKQGKVMSINVQGIPGCVGYGVKMKAYEQYIKH